MAQKPPMFRKRSAPNRIVHLRNIKYLSLIDVLLRNDAREPGLGDHRHALHGS
jgi:hypothetical protein